MAIFLSKFLPLFVYPVGFSSLMLLAALILRKKRRLQTTAIILSIMALFVGGNRWVAQSLARSLEWQYLPSETLPQADAIVVLGGATEPADFPRQRVEVNGAADRMLAGASLYLQGAAPLLVLSGGETLWLNTISSSQAEDMAVIVESLGVPEEALLLETHSVNTEQNAAFTEEILSARGVNRIILVTSALHMPRSVLLFESQGFEVFPAPADYSVTEASWQSTIHPTLENFFINLIPSAGNLSATTNAMKEYIGIWVYELTH